MKSDLKTFLIIALGALCAVLYFGARADREILRGVVSDLQKSQAGDGLLEFRVAFDAIQRIEAGEADSASFRLYQYADIMARDLDPENLPAATAAELAQFRTRYPEYMAARCAADHIDACEASGVWLAERQRFDEAQTALLKAAEAGSLGAMAELVDLYRVKEWSGYSEERAQQWLGKVGRPPDVN